MPTVLSVLFTRCVFPVAISSLIARLPKGMTPLATGALMYDTTGSYSVAGLVVGAMALGDAMATPAQGRLIDRFGRARVLLPSAAVYTLALVMLAVLAVQHRHLIALVGCALVTGVGFPPISGSMKALWPRLVSAPATTRTAYAAESLLQQVLLLIAPLLATAVMVGSTPAAALWIAGAAVMSGTLSFVYFAASATTATTTPARSSSGSALRIRVIRVIVAATAVQGMVFGAFPLILPALARRSDAPSAGALLLAAWICGGIFGSFIRSGHRYQVLLARFALALTIPAITAVLSGGWLPPVAVALGLAGLLLTPIAAASYLIVETRAPSASRTEAFAWLSTALAVGGSTGAALAGVIIERCGASPALLLPVAAAAVAAAIATRGEH